jgi:hypothetical protein
MKRPPPRHQNGHVSASSENPASKVREHRAPNLRRSEPRKTPETPALIVAYDYETTRIKPGTPRPTYLTAYAQGECAIHLAEPIRDMAHLHALIVNNFLTDAYRGVKFVAWNANNFDTYFSAAALVTDERYVLRPYMTRSNSLRGLKVIDACDVNNPKAKGWEFLDGIAMLGLQGVSLEKFLDNFAPDFKKLVGTIDFDKEEFDPTNSAHCAYAMRDSVGLWHGMVRAQAILMQRFNQALRVTMGGACIRIFKRHIPAGVTIKTLHPDLTRIIRSHVLRGGFCYCVRRYQGPVWKCDLNQAYAAAMREAQLPCGDAYHDDGRLSLIAKFYVARLTATNENNEVPFYYRTEVNGRLRSMFATTEIRDTWLTSIEVEQLRREGWKIHVTDSWFWMESFSMREYVDSLENMRMQCEGGPSGPIGTMLKMVGNHSYGKTLEQLDGNEFALSARAPVGFVPHYPDNDDADPLPFVYVRALEPDEIRPKDYHQPQLGAWITAHVRMVVRRAALIDPESWLYADTDCVVFSRDVTASLNVHPSKYGAWKIEESGTEFQIIAKKVYFDVVKRKGHAKGLNVKRLTPADFASWFDGEPPEQEQTQRQNFLRVMQGAEMYRRQVRAGTSVEKRIL